MSATSLPGSGFTGLRLVRLHLSSRRVPVALILLAAGGVLLRAALHWHWIVGSGAEAQRLPAIIEAGTAAVIAVATHSPFGESERTASRWLPWLRVGTVVLLIAAAIGALAAGAAAAALPGGILPVLRNVAGEAGLGLLAAAAAGGALAWVGPIAYTMIVEYAIVAAWQTPWIWPARPPGDHGADLCAVLVLAAGLTATLLHGARD